MPTNIEQLTRYLESRLPNCLDLLQAMVNINSFTANPDGVNRLGHFTAEAFASLGFASEFIPSTAPEIGSHLVLAKDGALGKEAPTIALISHLDTVFAEEEERQNNFCWRPEGDRIYGPGTVDIKGGTAMIHLVLSAIRELHAELYHRTNWLILFNAAEEILEHEFGRAARSIIPSDTLACLVFEGGRLRDNRFSIVTARKGMVTYKVEAEGKAAHAGSSHASGANAITQLARTVNNIAGMTDYDRGITFNVGTFDGGTVINRVPHYAAATGEMRAFSPELLNSGVDQLMALERSANVHSQNGDFSCAVKVDIRRRWEPWPPNNATDGLLSNWLDAARMMQAEVVRDERGGLSDGNFLWDHVPTLDGLGPSGGNAHCSERSPDRSKDQEFVEVSSIVPKATLNALAIARLLQARL